MTIRIATQPVRVVQRFTATDSLVHDFAAEDLEVEDKPGTTYVPMCQRDWTYPGKRFFSGELRDPRGVGRHYRCSSCRGVRR